MQICVFEDRNYRNLLPLVYFRPVYELRCGMNNLLVNMTSGFRGLRLNLSARAYMTNYLKDNYPGAVINALPDDDTVFLNGRILAMQGITKQTVNNLRKDCIFYDNNDVAVFYCQRENIHLLRESLNAGVLDCSIVKGCQEKKFQGILTRYPWELIHNTSEEIERNFRNLMKVKSRTRNTHKGAHLINKNNIFIARGTLIKPGVVLDAERGPIIIQENVTIMPNAVIQGPVYIGRNSLIKAGATIYPGTSIGEYSKVGGEIECSIIQSYSNKQHSGYLGHSYLGSWVNLGADTNTSDLKNNYSTVRVHVDGVMVDTDKQFVGLTIGDHSKSGINVMFDTGTVVGVSCNIYGSGLPPKYVPSFAWGGGTIYTEHYIEKSIETMKKVMVRRDVIMTDDYERMVRDVFVETADERRKAGII